MRPFIIALALVLSTVAMALPDPRYTVDGLQLTQIEAQTHYLALAQFYRQQAEKIQRVTERVAEAEEELADLTARRDATADQGEKDALQARIDKTSEGVIERGKYAIEKLETASPPVVADQRRATLRMVYNEGAGILRHDPDGNGVITLAELRPDPDYGGIYWPAFLFNAIDADDSNMITPQELQAHLDAL